VQDAADGVFLDEEVVNRQTYLAWNIGVGQEAQDLARDRRIARAIGLVLLDLFT
jgi:hypothetical protein